MFPNRLLPQAKKQDGKKTTLNTNYVIWLSNSWKLLQIFSDFRWRLWEQNYYNLQNCIEAIRVATKGIIRPNLSVAMGWSRILAASYFSVAFCQVLWEADMLHRLLISSWCFISTVRTQMKTGDGADFHRPAESSQLIKHGFRCCGVKTKSKEHFTSAAHCSVPLESVRDIFTNTKWKRA